MVLTFEDVKETVEKYKSEIRNEQPERERARELCYNQFYYARQLHSCDYDYLSLHLSSYLACWGMFRNSFLLKTNYKVHVEPVKLIMQSVYEEIVNYIYRIQIDVAVGDEIKKTEDGSDSIGYVDLLFTDSEIQNVVSNRLEELVRIEVDED